MVIYQFLKDDSPSYLPRRLAATVVAGAMYERLGRMMGRSYEETVQVRHYFFWSVSSNVAYSTPVGPLACDKETVRSSKTYILVFSFKFFWNILLIVKQNIY